MDPATISLGLSAAGALYGFLVYVLPEKKAKKLTKFVKKIKPVYRFLSILAKTPAGIKWNKK